MDGNSYPVAFSVDFPDRELDRLTSVFRIFMVIPIGIVLGTVAGGTWQWTNSRGATETAAAAGGLLFFGPLLMILFRLLGHRGACGRDRGVVRDLVHWPLSSRDF